MNLKELTERYPALMKDCFDYSPPPGWKPIVEELLEKLAKDPKCAVAQVKSKFGGLRVYYINCTEENEKLVNEAVEKAGNTCEECGADSAKGVDVRGWLWTLCEACEKVKVGK